MEGQPGAGIMATGGLTLEERAHVLETVYGPFRASMPKSARAVLRKRDAQRKGAASTSPATPTAKPQKERRSKGGRKEIQKVIGGKLSIIKAGPNVRVVSGVVVDESVDMDGQITDYQAAVGALEAWAQNRGSVRLQHQPGGVGKVTSVLRKDQVRQLVMITRVIDKKAVRLLDEGVLTGYSWGAMDGDATVRKDGRAPNGRIFLRRIAEVSLVDNPSNQSSHLSVMNPAQGAIA
jgi:hypothetical protein